MTQIILTKSGGDLIATDERGHSVRLVASLDSLRLLMTLLDGKAGNPDAKLGTPFRPTQQMVNEFLSNRKIQTELQHQLEQTKSNEELKEMF